MNTAILIINCLIMVICIISSIIFMGNHSDEFKENTLKTMLIVVLSLYIIKDVLHCCKRTFESKIPAKVETEVTTKNGVTDTTYIYKFYR